MYFVSVLLTKPNFLKPKNDKFLLFNFFPGSCGVSFRTKFVFNDTETATYHRNIREKGKQSLVSFFYIAFGFM